MRIAVCYIAIGEYIRFLPGFLKSCRQYFLPASDKEYFVFTDTKELPEEAQLAPVHQIVQEDLGWPKNTLYRFHMFLSQEESLKQFDYIFFFNANLRFQQIITEEEFLPIKEDLLVMENPGMLYKPTWRLTYERDVRSTAYISYYSLRSRIYVMGGLCGGKTKPFLDLCKTLKQQIDQDEKKGIVAVWHDESHLNKYLLVHTDIRLLSGTMITAQQWELPPEDFPFLLLDKEEWITYSKEKQERPRTIPEALPKTKIFLLKQIEKIKRRIKRYPDPIVFKEKP